MPSQPDLVLGDDEAQCWEPTPLPRDSSEARLIVVQITDVYTLENFASLKTMLKETREKAKGATVISVLTGDFLSPYLLSSVDRGSGMMNAIIKTPIDYLTWGNHEADISHKVVCRHVRNFHKRGGKFINSNMLDHEAMDAQQEYDIVEVKSPDGSQTRRLGLIGVLSDDPALYAQFKEPGAFGGATITNPWEALKKYQDMLQDQTDFILPLQHLYVPDDHITCERFDFPVVLSGHDHHRVDNVVHGTRLLKPGMNGLYATVLELSWPDHDSSNPDIRAQFVKVDTWEPDEDLEEECERAYDALIPLRNTELSRVPKTFEPLSSNNSRGSVCTMGKYICTLLRSSLNVSRRQRKHMVDAVLLMGGNIRGNAEYPEGSFFSLEALEAEIKSDEVIAVVPMPGWLVAEGIEATHAGDPIPGWMQYDEGVQQDEYGKVTHIGGNPIEPNTIYRVATKIGDLTNGQSPPLTAYYTENRHLLPPKGAYSNIQSELMSYFARNMWRKIWDALSMSLREECGVDDCNPRGRLELLDTNESGDVSVEEIQIALRDLVGLSVDDREKSIAEFVLDFADTTGDGKITFADMDHFCQEMDEAYERDKWRLAYPKAPQSIS